MNKYKNINPESLSVPEIGADRQIDQYGVGGGIRFDTIPRGLQLDESPDLSDVRFFGDTLAREYGYLAIGADAPVAPSALFRGSVSGTAMTLYRFWLTAGVLDGESTDASSLAAWASLTAGSTAGLLITSLVNIYDRILIAHGNVIQSVSLAGTIADLSASAPIALSIGAFGTRVLAFTSDTIYWPVSGDVTDWTGSGSGTVVLGESGDFIWGGVQVGHNTFAMFRQNSIWRAFQTGNVSQAIGFTPWIDKLGTVGYDSFANTGKGVVFVGTDYAIYLLTPDGGLINIGWPIDKEFRRTVIGAGARVGYHQNTGEVWVGNASTSVIWVLDFARFMSTQKLVWRKRTHAYTVFEQNSSAYPTFSSGVKTFYSLHTHTDKNGTAFTGNWWSRPLNKGSELASLTLLTIYYTSPSSTTFTVKTSGDGGVTVKETKSNVTLPAAADGGVVTIGLNTTGVDVRFKIELDTTVAVRITGYHPTMIHRGSVEYD